MIQLIQKGGPVMYLLLACSVVSLSIIIERGFFWINLRRTRSIKTLNLILRLMESSKLNMAIKVARRSRDFVATILLEGIKNYEYNFVPALDASAGEQLDKMKKYMIILDTIITLAPLLGILGTVIGIIHSFGLLGAGTMIEPGAVTGGIAEALITTASGLAIAIFTLIPFNYFSSLIESSTSEIEKYVNSLHMLHFKKGK